MKATTGQHKKTSLLRTGLITLLLGLTLTAPSPAAQDFDHTHSTYTAILKAHVTSGRVDYQALSAEPRMLTRYLDTLATVSEQQFLTFTEAQQLAFLFNLYNAATLKLVVDHYPVKSIKDIGSWFKGPWNQPVVRLFGTTITLNNLEHELLRKDYTEPRLHLALVCAAQGCPPLRSEAYTAEKLNAQLNNQARTFLGASTGLRIDRHTRTVYVSSIFKWYGKDFISIYTPGAGFAELNKIERAVAAFCSRYVSDQKRAYLMSGGYTVKYSAYDWSLNERGGAK